MKHSHVQISRRALESRRGRHVRVRGATARNNNVTYRRAVFSWTGLLSRTVAGFDVGVQERCCAITTKPPPNARLSA